MPPPRSTRPAAVVPVAAASAVDLVRGPRRRAAHPLRTRGAVLRRRGRSAVATTNRRSDPQHSQTTQTSKKRKETTHGQVHQAAPGSGKADQGAQMRLLLEEG